MFCTKCGMELPKDVKFCPNCGTQTENNTNHTSHTYNQQDDAVNAEFTGDTKYGDFIDSDVRLLVGKEKEEYYTAKFFEMKSVNKKATWNWPAFLVAPMWLFYRKMYTYGLILLVFDAVIGSHLSPVLSLAVGAVIAVFANYIYMTHLEKLALQAKSLSGVGKDAFIKEKGGTSAVAVLVCIGISMAISTVISAIVF